MLIFLLFPCFFVFYRAKIGTFAFVKRMTSCNQVMAARLLVIHRNWFRK